MELRSQSQHARSVFVIDDASQMRANAFEVRATHESAASSFLAPNAPALVAPSSAIDAALSRAMRAGTPRWKRIEAVALATASFGYFRWSE